MNQPSQWILLSEYSVWKVGKNTGIKMVADCTPITVLEWVVGASSGTFMYVTSKGLNFNVNT